MTPIHPLTAKQGPLTRDELLELVHYEGFVGISDGDEPAAVALAAEGLVEITRFRGQPHVTNLAPASRDSQQTTTEEKA